MTTSRSRLIIDTNILIDLDRGGILKDLFALPYIFIAPDVIIEELHEPPGNSLLSLGLQCAELSGQQVLQVMTLASRHSNIAINDLFALVIAMNTGLTLLTGDRRLRELASKQRVDVHGTLWVLDELAGTRTLHPQKTYMALHKMLENGSRLPRVECEERFRIWGDE